MLTNRFHWLNLFSSGVGEQVCFKSDARMVFEDNSERFDHFIHQFLLIAKNHSNAIIYSNNCSVYQVLSLTNPIWIDSVVWCFGKHQLSGSSDKHRLKFYSDAGNPHMKAAQTC